MWWVVEVVCRLHDTLVSMEASLSPVSKFLKTVVTASISVVERMSWDQEGEQEPSLGRLSLTTALLITNL